MYTNNDSDAVQKKYLRNQSSGQALCAETALHVRNNKWTHLAAFSSGGASVNAMESMECRYANSSKMSISEKRKSHC